MKIILQKNVYNLGKVGDIVEAKDGYFRNFLQPRALAIGVTAGALKKREQELEALRIKAEKLHKESCDLAQRITELGSIKISAKAGDAGKLYGKITNKDIALVISQALGETLDKRGVRTLEDIQALGTYKAYIRIAADVQAELNVEVFDETFASNITEIKASP